MSDVTMWTSEELATIEAAEELEIAGARPDGTLRKPTTIWVVREGDDVYLRSVYGPTSAWFRGVQVRHEGRIRAGGVEKDAIFEDVDDDRVDDQVDAAYRAKYGRYAQYIIDAITGPEARSTTLRVVAHPVS
jgi:hypothetical protein